LWSFPSASPRHDAPTPLLFDEEHHRNTSIRACTIHQHLTGWHDNCNIAEESDPFFKNDSWDERSVIQVSRFMCSINASTFCRLMGWGRARRESKRTRRHPNQRGLPSQRAWVPFASRVYRRLFNLFHPVTLACLSLQQQPDAAERDSTGNSSCRRRKWERRVCKNMHIHRHAPPSPEVVGSSRYYWPLEHPTPWQGTGRPACKLAGHLGWIGLHTRQDHRLCMNADIHLAHAVAG
jgi:hypothetical protein